MKRNKKEEKFQITVYGALTHFLKIEEDHAKIILDTLELIGRRRGFNNPAILLKGIDSEIIDVEYKRGKKNDRKK